MKYLFILGRNIELSVAELRSFFRKNNWKFEKIKLAGNGLLVESSAKIGKGTVPKLGGTISVGEVLASGDAKEIFSQLGKIELHSGKSNKLNYVVHDFGSEILKDAENYLKQRFKAEKLKATEKKLTGSIQLQGGASVAKVASSLIDEQFFIFSSKDENYFGRIFESSDYGEIEKRDMQKPVRRNELAISPRLAKILVNLSEVSSEKGEILLDPFCGIGVVLQEALLQRIKATGIDIDKTAVAGARQNLEFFGFDKKNYKLINGDSSKIKINEKISGVATEPDLGKLQKSVPGEEEARKIIGEFEKLMIKVLNNIKENVKGKIAFTAPLIFAGKKGGRIGCDFKRIANSTGLKICEGFPIQEFRERFRAKSIIGRSIVVLESSNK